MDRKEKKIITFKTYRNIIKSNNPRGRGKQYIKYSKKPKFRKVDIVLIK